MRNVRMLLVAALVGALLSCGQKGPLVLPDAEHPHKKIGLGRPPASPIPTPATTPAPTPAPAAPTAAQPPPAAPPPGSAPPPADVPPTAPRPAP